jgi:hypothetical protein
VRPNTALSTTLGTAARITMDGARTTMLDTVKADPVAVGWFRLTDGDPCAVLRAVGVARDRVQERAVGGLQGHNDCGCSAVPAFTRDAELPPIARQAAQIYNDHAKGEADQLAAFRKAWTARNAH